MPNQIIRILHSSKTWGQGMEQKSEFETQYDKLMLTRTDAVKTLMLLKWPNWLRFCLRCALSTAQGTVRYMGARIPLWEEHF